MAESGNQRGAVGVGEAVGQEACGDSIHNEGGANRPLSPIIDSRVVRGKAGGFDKLQ